MTKVRTIRSWAALSIAGLFSAFAASAQTVISNQVEEVATLSGETIEMSGRSELRITGSGTPISGCTINMTSVDSWVFFPAVVPSSVSSLLGQFKVNGSSAVLNSNVKVVQYGAGAVVIPYPSSFKPLTVYDGENFSGASMQLSPYTQYGTSQLGTMASRIGSFVLKRGYTATFAQNADGSGRSRNYVAADGDLEIGVLPDWMDNRINFVRVFPWRWTSKKGSCDVAPTSLDADWHYNWDINKSSTLDWEYVGIRQTRWWPGLGQDWQYRGINQLLGYNEPNNSVEDSYTSLNNGDVATAVATWTDLLGTGLRVGAPAVTDAGYSWISSFISQADAAGYRVDYVPVHYYRGYSNNDDPAGAASAMYSFLKSIHDMSGRPIWVTEFNNGANWTTTPDPTTAQNKNVIEAMINMMDSTPWIERYAVYSRVEWARQTHYDDGGITPMGQMYKDHVAPIAYTQEMKKNRSRVASYYFENDCRDDSGCGNNAIAVDIPVFSAGKHGQAIELGDSCRYLQLPGDIVDSSSFTFAAWINWDGGSDNQRIFDFGNYDLSQYMVLTPSTGGKLGFGLRNGGSTSWVTASSALPSGSWQHVAVTMSGTTAKLYLNGVQQASGTISVSALSGTGYNYLGKSQWSTDPLFSGRLDEVQIANYAMTQADIASMMNNTMQMQLSTNLVVATPAEQGVAYSGSVAGVASDPDAESITYVKIYGPAWLTIDTDGTLSGMPGYDVDGPQLFTVRALDSLGERRYFTLSIDLPYVLGDGTWTADSDGLWSDAVKWSGNLPANGAGYAADFSTINITANRTVALDSSHELGSLKFGDTSGSQSWTIADGGGVLTLDAGTAGSPSIVVGNTATIEASLSGSNGFSKSGAGTLVLAGASSLSGTVYIDTSLTSGSGGSVRAAYSSALANVDSVVIRNNNSGYSTLQLDGSMHGDVISPAAVELSGRNVSIAAIRNMAGENVLYGGVTIHSGGSYYILQSDAGTLELDGLLSSGATGTRTFTFQGTGDTRLSGIIGNGSADTVNVIKSGAGRLLLDNRNTYSGTTTVSGGELVVNGTAGAGAVSVGNSATLSGGGSVASLTAQSGSVVSIGDKGFPFGPDTSFSLVDDFNDYASGTDGASLAPVWIPGFPGGGADSSSTLIGADAGTGQALHYVYGGSGGQMNYASIGTIAAEGGTGTLFFQVRFAGTGSDTLFALGRSGAAAYSDLASLMRIPSDLIVEVHNSAYANTATSLSLDTLYNFWVVIDNSANTSSLYYSPGGAGQTPVLIQSGYVFRSTTAGDIDTFYLGSNSGSAGFVDNIYIDSTGANLSNPLNETQLVPKAGTLNVAGNFTLAAGATLEFDLSSPELYDRLDVGGQFAASGMLKVTFDPEQTEPDSGDRFELIHAGSASMDFSGVDLPELAFGLGWDTSEINSGVLSVKPDASYYGWAFGYAFASGTDAPDSDADGDAVANAFEWLFGTDPLVPDEDLLPKALMWTVPETTNNYLSFSATVRKETPGMMLLVPGAASIDLMNDLSSTNNVVMHILNDLGEFEEREWIYIVPVEDADAGFMGLRLMEK
ncbi:MAG: autotransporter-associated beta strand repeat-containing protein [Pontiellaceae bacterium]|nr:autotransporter-associated beta strand repeat-containing protein [Pontiellaceae bacterium]MBN2783672.1 autotransporter-associated beta strand repeat-containing protein [Pontiellaceae bacterium]